MTDEIRRAMEARLAALESSEARRARIRERIEATENKGGAIMKGKLSTAVALIMILMLLGGTAMAIGLGLFGQFAAENMEEDRITISAEALMRLEENAVSCEQRQTALVGGKEIEVTIHQSYCDGKYLYYSYTLPRGYHMGTRHELIHLTEENLYSQALGDAEMLPVTAISLPYRARNEWQRDGANVGYEVLLISKYVTVGESIDVKLSVEDSKGSGEAVFTLPVNGLYRKVAGARTFEQYHADAYLLISDVLAHGQVAINRVDWARRHTFGEGEGDYVCAYQLVVDGEVQENQMLGTTWHTGEYVLLLRFECPAEGASLALRPIYAQAGPCPGEDILLTVDTP